MGWLAPGRFAPTVWPMQISGRHSFSTPHRLDGPVEQLNAKRRHIMSNASENTKTKARPTHVVKARVGYGERARFERLGVAFDRNDGEGLYVKLTGKQVISSGFYLFPIEDNPVQAGAGQ